MGKLDQYKNGMFGFNTLSNRVDQYGLHADNEGQRGFARMSRIAADVWKDIYFQKLRVYKEKLLKIDLSTYTVAWPVDCLRVIGVNWVDCDGRKHYMAHDGQANTARVEIPLTAKCGCNKCGCTSDACSSFNANTYTEQDVEINGELFKAVTKARICPNGDIMQEITEPYAIEKEGVITVEYRTRNVLVENIDVKECGCIVDTPINRKKCFDFCGYPINYKCEKPEGKYKVDEDTHLIHFFDCDIKEALVKYVSNGEENCKEILIPDYAVNALYTGMFHYSIRFKLNVGAYEKIRAQQNFEEECMELVKFLNPLDLDAIREFQTTFAKW
jgi:hypothetical protein